MESLRPEVAPFGIHTTIVNPGFFRTELLSPESTSYATAAVEDYDARREETVAAWNAQNGRQSGDPAKLAQELLTVRARSHRDVGSSRAPTPSPQRSRRSRTFRKTSPSTASCLSHSNSTTDRAGEPGARSDDD